MSNMQRMKLLHLNMQKIVYYTTKTLSMSE